MKKTITIIAVLFTAIMLYYNSNAFAKTASLQQLRNPNPVCYCVPAPGYDCVSPQTGNIYANYKIVCNDESTQSLP